jgi:hypothetical protein
MRFSYCLALALTVVQCLAVRADDEEKLALDKVPAKVLAAARQKFPQGKFLGASKEKEDGKIQYEIELQVGEKRVDVILLEDGSIEAIETIIAIDDLPKAVKTAIDAKYPKATLKVAEEITKKDRIDTYEVVLVTADKKKVEVVLKPDGTIEKEESKGDKKD